MGVCMHSFAIDVKGGEREKKNISINNKGGDCWTRIFIDVNMAIFKEGDRAKEEEHTEPRGAKRSQEE